MAVNDTIQISNSTVADTDSLIVDASATGTGAARITELGGKVSAEIYREIDTDGDGTFEISHEIDTAAGNWHSQGNGLRISTDDNIRLRLKNTSGSSGSLWAIGFEVDA